MNNLLKDLLMSDGISGYEENISKLIISNLSKICDENKIDKFGNVVCSIGKGKKKIMICAHMDEVGMIVKYINNKGYIFFSKIGGINDSILPGKIVNIINKKGKRIIGIIGTKPPHLMSDEEFKKPINYKNMFIDIGIYSKKNVLKILDIGDQIIFEPKIGKLHNNVYYGKSVDNRIGCYALIKILEKLKKEKDIGAKIYACATAQEEVGLKGAKVSSFNVNPDFALILDTTIAGDTPGIEEKDSSLKIGNGVAITIIEASGRGTIIPKKIRNFIIETAQTNKIPHQIDIINGGVTDGAVVYMNRSGILTGILSIPTKYIHAPVSIFNIKDINATIKLAVKIIKSIVTSNII
jgi:endoglucanase